MGPPPPAWGAMGCWPVAGWLVAAPSPLRPVAPCRSRAVAPRRDAPRSVARGAPYRSPTHTTTRTLSGRFQASSVVAQRDAGHGWGCPQRTAEPLEPSRRHDSALARLARFRQVALQYSRRRPPGRSDCSRVAPHAPHTLSRFLAPPSRLIPALRVLSRFPGAVSRLLAAASLCRRISSSHPERSIFAIVRVPLQQLRDVPP